MTRSKPKTREVPGSGMRDHGGQFFRKRMCYTRNNVWMSLFESRDLYSIRKVESPRIRFVYMFFSKYIPSFVLSNNLYICIRVFIKLKIFNLIPMILQYFYFSCRSK